MISHHKPRRSIIYGDTNRPVDGIRDQALALAAARTHANFTCLLSGYGSRCRPDGPYSGVRILRNDQRHQSNMDENNRTFAGNYSKGLDHDTLTPTGPGTGTGLVVGTDYAAFKTALATVVDAAHNAPLSRPASVAQIDSIPLPAPDRIRSFVNPLGGLAGDLEGVDPLEITIPPAPALASEIAAVEMVELYWMALARDIPFTDWGGSGTVSAAIGELHALNAQVDGRFAQHRVSENGQLQWSSTIDESTLFRGSAPGNDKGPYISQFLWRDVPFGTLDLAQTQVPPEARRDYMIRLDHWHEVQEGRLGEAPTYPIGRNHVEPRLSGPGGNPPAKPCQRGRRHIITLRDLAHYVHFDALHEAYFNAALILLALGLPMSFTNIYRRPATGSGAGQPRKALTQQGFGTFGGPHILVLVTEVATRALKAVWHQKWYVHRRLRPEAMGARVHVSMRQQHPIPNLVHPFVLQSEAVQRILVHNRDRGVRESFLLPMAFPEGSPTHPSYGAGHATVAGACVTVLKALFEPRCRLPELMLPSEDGTGELRIVANDDGLTVEGELNKLAANIAIGRNAAGVHYRSDYTKSLALGEAVAVAMLQEMALTFVEADSRLPVWTLPTFDGHWITIDKKGRLRRQGPAEEPDCPGPAERREAVSAAFTA